MKLSNKKKIIPLILIVLLSLFSKVVFAAWNGGFYTPGQTLNPECLPTDPSGNCNVIAPLTSLLGAVLTDQTVAQTIGATGARLAKLWATDIATNDLTVTNNVGIGTASPVNNLDIYGSSVGVGLDTSSATGYGPAIYFQRQNATKWYQQVDSLNEGTNQLDFDNASGTGVLSLLQNGNVGIGTASPSVKLQVVGQSGTGNTGVMNITGYDAYGQSLVMQLPSTGYTGWLSALMKASGGSGNAMGFGTHFTADTADRFSVLNHLGAENLTVLDTGNVGIGNTSPGGRLVVQGSDATSGNYALNVTNSTPTSLLYVRNDGNVGIGTTGPLHKLDISYNAADATVRGLNINQINNGTSAEASIGFQANGTTVGAFGFHTATDNNTGYFYYGNNKFSFAGTGGASQMTIDGSSGNVGIGTTAPGAPLHVYGTHASNTKTMQIGAGASPAAKFYKADGLDVIDGPLYLQGNYNQNVLIGIGGGNVGIGTVSPGYKLDVDGTTHITGDVTLDARINMAGNVLALPANSIALLDGAGLYSKYQGGTSPLFLIGNINNVTTIGWGAAITLNASSVNYAGIFKIGAGDAIDAAYGDINGDGMYFPGNQAIGFTTQNAVKMFIQSNGDVGIGNTSPGGRLVVQGSDATSGNYALNVTNSTPTSLLYVRNDGNVGIGTTGPAGKLHIVTTADNAVSVDSTLGLTFVRWMSGGTEMAAQNLAATTGDFQQYVKTAGGTWIEALRIQRSTGNVGIGTTSPGANLEVYGSTNPTIAINTPTVGTDVGLKLQYLGVTKAGFILNPNSGEVRIGGLSSDSYFPTFYSNNAEAMRITTTGNVGIGTTTPSYKLDVNGDVNIATGSHFKINGTNLSYSDVGAQVAGSYLTSSTGWALNGNTLGAKKTLGSIDNYDIGFITNNTEKMTILASNGNVGIGTTAPASALSIVGNISTTGGFNFKSGLLSDYSWQGLPLVMMQNNVSMRTLADGKLILLPVTAATSFSLVLGTANSPGAEAGNSLLKGSTAGLLQIRNGTDTADSNLSAGSLFSSGNVGIGNTSPGGRLVVQGNDTTSGNYALNVTNSTPTSLLYVRNDGNVGIGTASPASLLSVGGSSGLATYFYSNGALPMTPTVLTNISGSNVSNSTGTQIGLNFENSSATNNTYSPFLTWSRKSNSNNYNSVIAGISAIGTGNGPNSDWMTGALTFWTSGSLPTWTYGPMERMRIDQNGNVGIGTTGPVNKLDVNGSLAVGSYAGVNSGPSNGMIISGKVGIGNTNPTYTLDVTGDIAASSNLRATGRVLGGTGTAAAPDIASVYDTTSGMFHPNPGLATNLGFSVGGNEVMRMLSTGNVGIGTTAPGAKLEVSGGILQDTYTASGTNAYGLQVNAPTGATNNYAANFNGNVNISGSITAGSMQLSDFSMYEYGAQFFLGRTANQFIFADNVSGVNGLASYSRPLALVGNGNDYAHPNMVFSSGQLSEAKGNFIVDGNVGIGTTSPGQALDVNGSANINNNLQVNGDIILDQNSQTAKIVFRNTYLQNNQINFGYGLNSKINWWDGSGNIVHSLTYIDSTHFGINSANVNISNNLNVAGNVGIGTTSPKNIFEVEGTSPGTAFYGSQFTNKNVNGRTDIAVKNSTGESGVFSIFGNTFPTSGYPNNTQLGASKSLILVSDAQTANGGSSYISFLTGGYTLTTQERMRITNLGNVGIGTTSPGTKLVIGTSDLGSGVAGPIFTLGYNNNASPGAGSINFESNAGTAGYVWQDATGMLRINTSAPTNALDTSGGTVVGLQSSSLDSKNVIGEFTDYQNALQAISDAKLYNFTYKSGAYNNEQFTGIITDYSPIFGMDKDATHPSGKSLNMINGLGYTFGAIKALNLNLEGLSGTIVPLAGSASESFVTAFFNNIENKIGAWLADATNNVTNIFANVFNAKEKICVDGECLTKDDIHALLLLAHPVLSPSPTPTAPEPAPEVPTCVVPQTLVNNVCVDPTPAVTPDTTTPASTTTDSTTTIITPTTTDSTTTSTPTTTSTTTDSTTATP